LIDLLRHPLISPYLQTDTTPPEDEQGRKVRNSNIFSGEIEQWIQADVRRTSQDENALAVFLSIFSDGSQMHTPASWLAGCPGLPLCLSSEQPAWLAG
jgi:hypothetical protein